MKKVCMSGILPRLGENGEWWSRAIGVNEMVYMLCGSMNCSYLDVWKNFLDILKLYKKEGMHLNDKCVEVFAKRMIFGSGRKIRW